MIRPREEWLRETADDRIADLFSEDAELIQKRMHQLVQEASVDDEVEEIVLETFEEAIDQGNDDTSASVWLAVLLGELGTRDAIGPLLQGLAGEDEMLQLGAARALRRIGAPAFEALLEMLDDENTPPDVFVAGVECLEGVRFETATGGEAEEIRSQIESFLRERLFDSARTRTDLRKMEAAALALARLGVSEARKLIEECLEHVPAGSEAFLQEALELLDEHPEGLPVTVAPAWEDEFRWSFADLPGGELRAPGEDDEENG